MSASLSVVARRLDFIREIGGANKGYWVNFLQRHCDGVEGDSWCADFVSLVEDIAYKGKAPTPRSGSCQTKLDFCRKQGWIVEKPKIDDLYFFVDGNNHAHHIGIITATDTLKGIAGNTSEDGTSSNGDGVYEHRLNVNPKNIVFARLPG